MSYGSQTTYGRPGSAAADGSARPTLLQPKADILGVLLNDLAEPVEHGRPLAPAGRVDVRHGLGVSEREPPHLPLLHLPDRLRVPQSLAGLLRVAPDQGVWGHLLAAWPGQDVVE